MLKLQDTQLDSRSPLRRVLSFDLIFIVLAAFFTVWNYFYIPVVRAEVRSGQKNIWRTDSAPFAVLPAPDGSLYIGGNFTYVGTSTPYLALFDSGAGVRNQNFPNADGAVNAIVSDDSGGWYVGGSFTKIGGVTRNYLAHINSDGSVDTSWHPNANASVTALVKSTSTLYVGGTFSQIGGALRASFAEIRLTTASATPSFLVVMDEAIVGGARDLVLGTSTLYAGLAAPLYQDFNPVADGVIELRLSDGILTNWTPGGTSIYSMVKSTSTMYVAGDFTTIGGQSRNRLAEIRLTTASATAWNPNASAYPQSLALGTSTLYVGGTFTSVGGASRNRIAEIDLSTASATAWNPNASGTVSKLIMGTSTLYAGGSFAAIAGQLRDRIAELSLSTASATAWNPSVGGNVAAIGTSTTGIYAGGSFLVADGRNINYLARLDASGALDTAWNPAPNSQITAFALGTSTLYVGGAFTSIGGNPRKGLAEVNLTTASATAWNPNVSQNSQINGLSLSTSTLHVAGAFTVAGTIGGQRRGGLAELNLQTASATAWHPNVSGGSAQFMMLSTSTIYIGGTFTSIGGGSRSKIAELSLSTASATLWNPNANNQVNAFALGTSTMFVGGTFTSIGGQSRNRIAELNLSTASATAWNPSASQIVYAVTATSSFLFAGGTFTSIGGQTRNYLAELDLRTASATSWNPSPNNSIGGALQHYMAMSTSSVYFIGDFTSIDNAPYAYLAGYDFLVLSFSSSTSSASEASTSPSIGVTLSFSGSSTTTVDYAVSGGTAAGGGTDYTLASGTLTISPGTTTANIPFTVINDDVDESDETISVVLSSPSNAALGSIVSHAYTVTDNDSAGVTLSSTSTSATEGGATGSYTIVLVSQPSSTVTVTATSTSSEVTLSTTTLVFTSSTWNATQTVAVTAVDDSIVESSETATITHSAASSDANYDGVSIASTTVTITDNDSVSSGGGGGRSDSAPPVRSEGNPLGTLSATTTSAVLSLKTDEEATCKYSAASNGPMTTAYSSMPFFFTTTGSTFHTVSLSGLQTNQSYAYYVRCQDNAGNNNVDDFSINFSVAGADASLPTLIVPKPTSTPPASTTTELFPIAPSIPQPAIIPSPPLILLRALAPGTPGNDVLLLQEKLKAIGFFPETTKTVPNFGPQTKKSVQAYQCARKIVCGGTPTTTGYGRVGPKTRAALAKE